MNASLVGLPRVSVDFCEHCGHFHSELTADGDEPEGIYFKPETQTHVLRGRWLNWSNSIMTIMLVLVTYFITDDLLTSWKNEGKLNVWLMGLTLVLTYLSLAMLLNRTIISMHAQFLTIKRGPIWLPYTDSFHNRADQIESFGLLKHKSSSKHGTSISYLIRAITDTGDVVDVYDFGDDPKAAKAFLYFLNKKYSKK